MFGVLEAKRKGDGDHSALLTLVEERSGVRGHSNVTVASKSTSVSGVVNYAASGRTANAPSTAAPIEGKRTTSSGPEGGSGSSMMRNS